MSDVLLYKMVIEGFDFGPFVTKLIIAWNHETKDLRPEDFSVAVTKQGSFFEPTPIVEGTRKVIGASVSGKELTLELEVHPSNQIGNGFRVEKKEDGPGKFYVGNQWAYPFKHALTWKGRSFELECCGRIMPITDSFDISGKFTASDGVSIKYASFIPPEADNSKRPLIMWLHGAGEGSWFGTQEPSVAIMGNKAIAFAGKEMQELIGGAYVLAPQSPTMWMDDGSGAYTQDGTSTYTTALAELISRYLADHPNVDKKRIYIGGCSNGGFMTMRMILTKPELFAAAFPVCQAFKPEWMSDEQVKSIAHIPIWQVHSKDDGVVAFSIAETANERLLAAGGKNIQHTWYESMEDLSGLWLDEDGKPWKYDGHWSWIHAYNNDTHTIIDGKKVSLFEWLHQQSL